MRWSQDWARNAFAYLVSTFQFALEHLQDLGYHTALIRVDGLSSSTHNARQIRDAVVAMDLAPDERLVLVGYSKGTPDILAYPQDRTAWGRGQRRGRGQRLAAGRRCVGIDAHAAQVSARIGV